ncbi:hypothetical protein F8271_27515 [Micromonospora sp. ALFpr18c]|uniref:DUF3824 domain-containing protein n=1 Tax=unclassified Micromonospora TaxID=2617518 RepID=UPI00124B07C7|nr:DUF3824 domain-containing protein [Micromonospora sp. ALFpr18c]KAB1930706.1 hypothetical protein F8271_27515 [Micromonospora sp. ALFpr18c]
MSQPPATPYGPPHDSPHPPQQSGFPQQQGFPAPQPGQPYGDPSAPVGPPPAKKSKVGKIILIVLAVVLVLCLGGAAITWFAVKDEVGDVVDATKTRVVAPATLAGRAKNTDPQLQRAADGMVTEMKSTVQGETSAVGAFYGDPAKQDLIMIAAASGLVQDPKKEMDTSVTELTGELSLTNMATIEAGPLGGEARCGDGKAEGVPLGVCVWTDRGSQGLVILYFKSAEQAKAEFTTIRGEIEQRS